MSAGLEFVLCAAFVGVGGTLVMDLWAAFQKRVFGIPPLDYRMVGRWVGHLPRGRFVHDNIGAAASIPSELVIGWIAHYAIGVIFAALLLAVWGLDWARHPTLLPALMVGIGTVVAPFFITQPGMGIGVAAAKTPQPKVIRTRSLVAHASFGVGLYCAAWLWALLNSL
jgi:Protein of unknown function (DUF2938)